MKDQYDDKGCILLSKISNIIQLPEFVKVSSEESEETLSKLTSRCFADADNRKFPIHTKQDAYLSQLYFTKHSSLYESASQKETVAKNLAHASNIWKLPAITRNPMQKQAAAPTDSIVIRNDQEDIIDTISLNSARDFEKAAIQLFTNKKGFPYCVRKNIASQLMASDLKKTASISEDVKIYLEKASGMVSWNTDSILDTLKDRAIIYTDKRRPEFSERLCKIAEEVVASDVTESSLSKIATILDILDTEVGINKTYDDPRGIQSPEESLSILTPTLIEKVSSGMIKLQNGNNLDVSEIDEEVLTDFLTNVAGCDVAEYPMEEKIDILSSLPAPDADDYIEFAK